MLRIGGRAWPESLPARIAGEIVPVAVRVRANARHYRLTIGAGGRVVLSVPGYGKLADAERFLDRQRAWLEARLKRTPRRIAFGDGVVVPLRGADHLIVETGVSRGRVEIGMHEARPALMVPGAAPHVARRLIDWFKAEAKRDLEAQVARHAANLGVRPKSIHMRGQATRWGSCSSQGRLNFNWRLVLAPPPVIDYVAAHEVAHLLEMNHSPAFWATLARTLPEMDAARAWLRAHGAELMAYQS